MKLGLRQGNFFLPLLLIMTVAGFMLIKSVVNRTFVEAQAEVAANIQDRYDPYSPKYSRSKFMGKFDTWITFTNKRQNYAITHPKTWNKLETRDLVGTLDLYEAAISSNVILSITVQDNFVEIKTDDKFKSIEGKYTIFQREPDSLAAYIKKNNKYFIVRLRQDNYFGTEKEFGNTFSTILKHIEFLD